MKNYIGRFTPRSWSWKPVWLPLLIFLFSSVVVTTSLALGLKEGPKTVFRGVVTDAVNGMRIDSVNVSAAGITTRSNAQGVFTLEIPAKKSARV